MGAKVACNGLASTTPKLLAFQLRQATQWVPCIWVLSETTSACLISSERIRIVAHSSTCSNPQYKAQTGHCETSKIKPVASNTGYIRLQANNYTGTRNCMPYTYLACHYSTLSFLFLRFFVFNLFSPLPTKFWWMPSQRLDPLQSLSMLAGTQHQLFSKVSCRTL